MSRFKTLRLTRRSHYTVVRKFCMSLFSRKTFHFIIKSISFLFSVLCLCNTKSWHSNKKRKKMFSIFLLYIGNTDVYRFRPTTYFGICKCIKVSRSTSPFLEIMEMHVMIKYKYCKFKKMSLIHNCTIRYLLTVA